jgi:hypothetical protein
MKYIPTIYFVIIARRQAWELLVVPRCVVRVTRRSGYWEMGPRSQWNPAKVGLKIIYFS